MAFVDMYGDGKVTRFISDSRIAVFSVEEAEVIFRNMLQNNIAVWGINDKNEARCLQNMHDARAFFEFKKPPQETL